MTQAKGVPDEWLLNESSGEQLYETVLTSYIKKLNKDECEDMEEALLLILGLKNFMKNLKCPDSFPEGEAWWNPETMDVPSKNYLQLLIGLFDVIAMGGSEGKHTDNFRALMGDLFSGCLKGPIKLFRFLCLLWTYSYNLSSTLGCTVNAALQTRAICIGEALLPSQSGPTKKRV